MDKNIVNIRLDKLNIPSETLRQTSTPAAMRLLKESLQTHGVLVPIVVRALGKGEYDVWDGTRRVTAFKELMTAGSVKVPAIVVSGSDADSVVTQININQTRERLTNLAEAEALRQLVADHKVKQIDAAKLLLKTKSWASKIMKVWTLPKVMLRDMRKGIIPLSHALVISRYVKKPEIMNMLYEVAKKGGVTFAHLAVLGVTAEKEGVASAKKQRPKRQNLGPKSWLRIEPLQKGKRFEIHLDDSDNYKSIAQQVSKIILANK